MRRRAAAWAAEVRRRPTPRGHAGSGSGGGRPLLRPSGPRWCRLHLLAHFDPLAETARRHRVAHAPPLDLGDGHVDPAGLDIGRVEAPAGQGAEQARLDDEALGGDVAGAAVAPGVDPLAKPPPPAR